MKKKLLSLLLALVMVLSLAAPALAAEEIISGDWAYKITADGVVLTKYVGTDTEVVAPGTIDGHDVWALGPGIGCAFSNVRETMTSLTLEEGIDCIQTNAVKGCTALETVVIADTVTSISSSAFESCTSLSDVYLGEGVKTIGGYAFLNTNLVALYLPASVNYVYDYAFGYSGEWGDVEKNENFAIFGWAGTYAQSYATKWHFTFYFLDEMTDTSGRCGENATWRFEESTGTLYIEGEDDTAPYYNSIQPWIAYAEDITRVVIGEGIDHLGDYSFANFYPNLTEVVIPDSLSSLGNAAFLNCTGLTKIEITTELSYFGGSTFRNTGLKEVVFPAEAGYAPSIGGMCFADCKNLTYVKLPSEMDWSGDGLFMNCSKLSRVDMSGWTYSGSLGNEMFRNCDSLTDISFHTVTAIAPGMYQDCDGLTEIVIPDCVTYLHTDAFADCSNLTSVRFTGDVPNYNDNVFRNDTLTGWYPVDNATWTENHLHGHGGKVTWNAYDPDLFVDVAVDSFCHEPVIWAVDNGITTGADADHFNPTGECLRAQVVTFLWRAEGCPEPTSTENPFVDVKESDFYYKAVLWAVENGITTGSDATHFNPMGVCNRAQVVTFLHRAKGSPAPKSMDLPFTDVPADDWFTAPVAWAVENGITNGISATEFGPNAACNRAQVVTFLYRTAMMPEQFPDDTFRFTILNSDPTEETGYVYCEGEAFAPGESVIFFAEPWYGYLVEFESDPADAGLELYYLGAHTYELVMPAHDVTLTANFVPAQGSAHFITTTCTNGFAFAICDMDDDLNDFAKPGEYVQFYILPDEGYTFTPDSFTATANGAPVAQCWYLGEIVEEDPEYGIIDGIFLYELVMPDADVSVSIACTPKTETSAAAAEDMRVPVSVN